MKAREVLMAIRQALEMVMEGGISKCTVEVGPGKVVAYRVGAIIRIDLKGVEEDES